MSAWDIAGAVVWTPLAILFWGALGKLSRRGDSDAVRVGFPLTVSMTIGAAFCIARLFGAHA